MPRPAIDDSLWAEMTTAQQAEAVRAGQATLRQMVQGLLDGPDELCRTCREFLARTDPTQLSTHDPVDGIFQQAASADRIGEAPDKESSRQRQTPVAKRRLGLPRGYLPRLYRRERIPSVRAAAQSRSSGRGGSDDQKA